MIAGKVRQARVAAAAALYTKTLFDGSGVIERRILRPEGVGAAGSVDGFDGNTAIAK